MSTYRSYRRWRYRYTRTTQRTGASRSAPTVVYGGIDDDVRQLFFALDSFKRKLVFNVYERQHGEGARKYAEATFAKWRSGKVQMGGAISDRLVRIVPRFLTFDQKYDLIEKLWKRFRQKTTLNVTISPASGVAGAIEAVMGAIDAIGEHEIPTAVAERLEWLASDDAVVAQSLLGEVAKREGEIAVQTLEKELRQLLAIAEQHHDKSVSGTRTVELAAATVYIHVSQSVLPDARKPSMTNDHNLPDGGKSNQLARTSDGQPIRDLAPIQNPNDLLAEALKRMSPQKQNDIIEKASVEALRIQVKQADASVDAQRAEKAIDTVAQQAHALSQTGTEFKLDREERLEHGTVRVTVSNKRPSLSERFGGCFVATACYGDESHPAVMVLREFRDKCLRERPSGRAFILWYYRNSPPYARWIEDRVALRLVGRLALWPVVLAARLAVWLKSWC